MLARSRVHRASVQCFGCLPVLNLLVQKLFSPPVFPAQLFAPPALEQQVLAGASEGCEQRTNLKLSACAARRSTLPRCVIMPALLGFADAWPFSADVLYRNKGCVADAIGCVTAVALWTVCSQNVLTTCRCATARICLFAFPQL